MHHNAGKYSLSCLIFLFSLTACSLKPRLPDPTITHWSQQRDVLEDKTRWQINGKLAYKDKKERFSANIKWKQVNQKTDIRLYNNLGITLLELSVTPNVTVLTYDDKEYRRASADVLLEEITGWKIPVSRLVKWIKGLPFDSDRVQVNQDGLIKTITTSNGDYRDWNISYSDYTNSDNLWLPSNMTLVNSAQKYSFIKVKIRQWK